jgi:hypothetical protein
MAAYLNRRNLEQCTAIISLEFVLYRKQIRIGTVG